MNKYFTIVILLAALLFAVGTVYASHGAKSISFPVPELGNCGSYTACRDYCVDPTHYIACRDWAKRHNIHSGDIPEADKKLAFDNAKRTLGCDGQESCQTFCSNRENFDRCSNFSKKTGLVGGYMTDPSNEALLKRANEVLGCALDNQCKAFCDKEENRQKCAFFARGEGIGGGIREIGPGGCTSQASCQTFCQDPQNKDKCAGFVITPDTETQKAAPVTNQNPGPGGCISEKDCNSFCADPKNSQECAKYEKSSNYQWKGPGGCTSAASCAAYCRTNYTDPECGGGKDEGDYKQQLQQYEQQRQQNLQQFQQMQGQKQQYEQQFKEAEQQKQLKMQEYNQAQQQYQQKQQEYQQGQQQYQQKQQEYQQQQQQPAVRGTQTSRGLLQIILDRFGF